MNRDEALALLREGKDGVEQWNHRLANGETMPGLQNAFLINADLRGADLRGAYLVGVCLYQACLAGANLAGAQLAGADFRSADLRRAQLQHANLAGAIFGSTIVACDLSRTYGLDTVVHASRSLVDVHCLLCFRGQLPEDFLRGCGLADEEIRHLAQRIQQPHLPTSCFICHCAGDAAFAGRLHHDLQAAGIRCWLWNHDAEICEELVSPANPGFCTHDKIVLVLSERSLRCEAVNLELERIIQEGSRRDAAASQPGGVQPTRNLLYPLRLDNYVFEHNEAGQPFWRHPYREAVVNRPITDAVGWETDRAKYAAVRDWLIRTLGSEPAA